MQQTTTNATIIRWRNTPFWRPSSLRRSKLVSFYCHKIYSWELCALSTGFYSKEKSVLWQKKRDHPQIASVHFPVPVPSTSIENLSYRKHTIILLCIKLEFSLNSVPSYQIPSSDTLLGTFSTTFKGCLQTKIVLFCFVYILEKVKREMIFQMWDNGFHREGPHGLAHVLIGHYCIIKF